MDHLGGEPQLLSPFRRGRGASFTPQGMWCPHYPMLHELLHKAAKGFVLDVGSFDGRDAIAFGRAGHRVWSFEPSPGKVATSMHSIHANCCGIA